MQLTLTTQEVTPETRHRPCYLPLLSTAARPREQAPTFQAMFEAVLQHHEELLQGREVRVQRAAQAQGRLDEGFDTELHHVHQVGALLHGVVSHTWAAGTRVKKEKRFLFLFIFINIFFFQQHAPPAPSRRCGERRLLIAASILLR